MKPRAHAISAQEFGESGQHRIPPKCVTPRNQESGIRNQESESRSKCWNQESGIRNQESGIGIPVKMLESGIRNQESGIGIPVKMVGDPTNQEPGIRNQMEHQEYEERQENREGGAESGIGSGCPRESERKRRKREWRIRKLKAGPRWESLGRESEYLSRRGTWEGESSER